MNWESLRDAASFSLRRSGRYLVADLKRPHDALTTSARNGGPATHLRWLVNHQSCEGGAHLERHQAIHQGGPVVYHDSICAEIGVDASAAAVMGTAANMNYAAVVEATDADVSVTAIV